MKKVLLSFSALLAITTIEAQTTMTGSDLNPAIGHVATMYTGSYVAPGASGANQTWDLSALSGSAITQSYGSTTTSGANIRLTQDASGTTSTVDMQIDNTGQYWKELNGGGTVMSYSDPMMQLGLPLTYSQTINDNFQATFVSGLSFVRSGTETQTVDGYGTVITPEGTFTNVLRVHMHQDYSDVTTGLTIDYVTDIYTWYKAGVKDPIASVSEITSTANGNTSTSSYGSYLEATGLGIAENEIGVLSVYPNPATSSINIDLSENGVSNILVTDVQGKIYSLDYSVMGNKVLMNMTDLKSGVYFIHSAYSSGNVEAAKITKL